MLVCRVARWVVITSAAAGSARALARTRLRRRPPAEVRERHKVELAPNPAGEGIVIAVNPSAGSAGDATAAELAALLPAAEVVLLEDPSLLVAVLEAAAGEPSTVALGAVGGDGTLSAAAAVAAAQGLPLLAVPGGTLNHLARDLGLSDMADAVEAVAEGAAIEVDLPTIGGRPFLNTASFGSYAALVDAREALEDRVGKGPALLLATMRVLRHGTPISVELDGVHLRLRMIFMGNCRYRPDGFAPSHRARLDDGQLDVRLIDAGHPWCRVRLLLGLVTGRLGQSPVYRQWSTASLVVSSLDGPLRLAADGETFDGPARVEVVKGSDHVVLYSYASRGSTRSGSMP